MHGRYITTRRLAGTQIPHSAGMKYLRARKMAIVDAAGAQSHFHARAVSEETG